MLDFASSTNLVLLLIIIIIIRPHLHRWHKRLQKRWQSFKQRQWKPGSPQDCDLCCQQVGLQIIKPRAVIPYSQTKSPRGRKKSVATRGFACPNPDCHYCGITDNTVHALVGYGTHHHIARFKCQACGKVFTSRFGTPLYSLKSSPERVEMVVWFLVEGVDLSVMLLTCSANCSRSDYAASSRPPSRARQSHFSPIRLLPLAPHLGLCPVRAPSPPALRVVLRLLSFRPSARKPA